MAIAHHDHGLVILIHVVLFSFLLFHRHGHGQTPIVSCCHCHCGASPLLSLRACHIACLGMDKKLHNLGGSS
ncbi:hypothetical protein M758_2G180300 [Ceratodon purpureus]|nr:hypothetical protein M758_2G180300 [Ceratodon purpureus]